MALTINQIAALTSLLCNEEISRNQIGSIIGLSRQSTHRNKDKELDEKDILKIEEEFNIAIPRNFEIIGHANTKDDLRNRFINIPYWHHENCENDKIKDKNITSVILDLELIVHKLNCDPENLKVIAMPGEEMDGGTYPLKNGDILLIDTSQCDYSNSGVYFLTTQNNKMVFVRRLLELMYGALSSSVDNPTYAPQVNKTFTMKTLDELDFKIVGRVIKNLSLKI